MRFPAAENVNRRGAEDAERQYEFHFSVPGAEKRNP
jgi:hypothetical protein